jgi:hypothetical protein
MFLLMDDVVVWEIWILLALEHADGTILNLGEVLVSYRSRNRPGS